MNTLLFPPAHRLEHVLMSPPRMTRIRSRIIRVVAMFDRNASRPHDIRLSPEDKLIAAVVTFTLKVVMRPDQWVGAGTADFGQVVRRSAVFLLLSRNEADKRAEKGNRGGNDGCAHFGCEPDEWEGCAIGEVGVAGNEADCRGFV